MTAGARRGQSENGEIATPAGIYDYFLNGKEYGPADEAAAKKLLKIKPDIQDNMLANREFLVRVVRWLAKEKGIRQFLDIGTGMPTNQNVHEIAQAAAPECRIVYVDNNPMVMAHARALLSMSGSEQGEVAYVEADLVDSAYVLSEARRTLNFSEPVAIVLIGILHFISDELGPYEIVADLAAAMAPGSYLVISHPADSETARDRYARSADVYERQTGIPQRNRNKNEVARFFDGLRLLEPGVVRVHEWHPEKPGRSGTTWAAIGYKA